MSQIFKNIPLPLSSSLVTPPGSNKQVIFNDASALGASSMFTFDKTNGKVYFPILADLSANMLLNISTRTFYANDGIQCLSLGRILYNSAETAVCDWEINRLYSSPGYYVLDWISLVLYDNGLTMSIDWASRNLHDSSSLISLGWDSRYLVDFAGMNSIEWGNRTLHDTTSTTSASWDLRQLFNSTGGVTVDWAAHKLIDSDAVESIQWHTRKLYNTSGVEVFNWNSTAIVISGTSLTTTGSLWTDTTQKAFKTYQNGVTQILQGVIGTQTATGTIGNSVTETAITSTGVGTYSLPSNFLVAGKTIKITGRGIHSATASPTLTIKIKFGSTVILTTGAINTGNSTNEEFNIEALITCRTTGVSGTVFAQGSYLESSGTSARDFGMVNTAATTVNTTTSQTISVTAQWSVANASNTISLTNFVIEVLN